MVSKPIPSSISISPLIPAYHYSVVLLGFSFMKQIFKVACLGEAMALFKDFLPVASRPLFQNFAAMASPKIRLKFCSICRQNGIQRTMAYILIGSPYDQGCDLFKVHLSCQFYFIARQFQSDIPFLQCQEILER